MIDRECIRALAAVKIENIAAIFDPRRTKGSEHHTIHADDWLLVIEKLSAWVRSINAE